MGSSKESVIETNIESLNQIPHEILKRQIVTYFETQKLATSDTPEPRPFTLPGLALSLGVTLKDLILYPNDGVHSSLIANAKARCESDLIDRMFAKKIDRSTGLMILKNHFGYIDIAKAITAEEKKREKEFTKEQKVSISDILDAIEEQTKKK
jgi:hypothetical protein